MIVAVLIVLSHLRWRQTAISPGRDETASAQGTGAYRLNLRDRLESVDPVLNTDIADRAGLPGANPQSGRPRIVELRTFPAGRCRIRPAHGQMEWCLGIEGQVDIGVVSQLTDQVVLVSRA